jgi:hypothetical protein
MFFKASFPFIDNTVHSTFFTEPISLVLPIQWMFRSGIEIALLCPVLHDMDPVLNKNLIYVFKAYIPFIGNTVHSTFYTEPISLVLPI